MEEILKKITKCLYVIIALLIVLIILVCMSLGEKDDSGTTVSDTNTEEEESQAYDVSIFKSITSSEFVDAFNGDEKQIIYMGRPTCGYCVKFLPNLQKAQEELKYETLYLDVSAVDESGVEEIRGLDQFFEENYGSTPIVVIVEKGKVVDYLVGYTDYDTLKEFLEKNGY